MTLQEWLLSQLAGNTLVKVTPAMNNTVPGVITPNSQSNLATTLSWNGFLGLTQNTGPNGATALRSYDSYGRLATSTSPHGAVTTYEYTSATVTQTSVNGRWTKTTTDGLGRTKKVESGHGTTTVSVVETTYAACACSPLGKVSQESLPYTPGGTKHWTTYTYDAMGRTKSVAQPSNTGTTTYDYAGNTVTVTDPKGNWKRFTQNAVGELVKVTEPNRDGGEWDKSYTYNPAGAAQPDPCTT